MGFSTYLHEWNHSMKYLKMKINQLFNLKLCQLIKIQKQLSSFALLCMKIAHLLPFHIVEAYHCLNLSIPSVLTSKKKTVRREVKTDLEGQGDAVRGGAGAAV